MFIAVCFILNFNEKIKIIIKIFFVLNMNKNDIDEHLTIPPFTTVDE